MTSGDYSFIRYLAAKKSVDDRALNAHVRAALLQEMVGKTMPSVLEVGAGIGTMVERLHQLEVLRPGTSYLAIDAAAENVAEAQRRLRPLANTLNLSLEAVDLFELVQREAHRSRWDLLVANAFLDLVDLDSALPQLLSLLQPDGLFYFTINFDGGTILHPVIDSSFDEQVIALYHQTMDGREVHGRPSGHSHTGRRLFSQLPAAGAQIIAAGSSDWVVFAGPDGYLEDEAYFLHFIIHTIDQALAGSATLDQDFFGAWIAERHAQIEAGRLVYIAHQLDFFGRLLPQATG